MSGKNRRGRPPLNGEGLSKALIIRTTSQMMQDSGNIPSLRAIASELKVDAMAIYYYFNNKSELLEALTTHLMSQIYQPLEEGNWQNELTRLAQSYIDLLACYDGLLVTLLSIKSQSPATVFAEKFDKAVASLPLTKAQKAAFLGLVIDYLHGFSLSLHCDTSNQLRPDDMNSSLTILFKGIESL